MCTGVAANVARRTHAADDAEGLSILRRINANGLDFSESIWLLRFTVGSSGESDDEHETCVIPTKAKRYSDCTLVSVDTFVSCAFHLTGCSATSGLPFSTM